MSTSNAHGNGNSEDRLKEEALRSWLKGGTNWLVKVVPIGRARIKAVGGWIGQIKYLLGKTRLKWLRYWDFRKTTIAKALWFWFSAAFRRRLLTSSWLGIHIPLTA